MERANPDGAAIYDNPHPTIVDTPLVRMQSHASVKRARRRTSC